MEAAGKPMEALGNQMEALGAQQEKLVAQAELELRRLIDRSSRPGPADALPGATTR